MNFRQMVAGSVFVGSTVLTSLCHAGWSSGGGELVRDANNPWFLSNTKEVKYCIQIDEKNFGQTKTQVRERVRKAMQFWQIQLKDLQYALISTDTVFDTKIGTQNFSEEDCGATTDIVFQFGTLTAEQKEKLKDLSKTIGITVRTDYDEVNMKGKGFVYIAPESGSLKPEMDVKMWSVAEGAMLLPVLIHEAGHIFGLQHDSNVYFMAEDDVQNLFSFFNDPHYVPLWWTDFDKDGWQNTKVFKHDPFAKPMRFYCAKPTVIPVPGSGKPKVLRKSLKNRTEDVMTFKKFFNISVDGCVNSYIQNGKFIISTQTANNNDSGGEVILGEMKLQVTTRYYADKPVIKVWFPEKQNVLPGIKFFQAFPFGYMYSEVYYKGNYVSADGKTTRRILLTATPYGVKSLGGTLNGEIYQNVGEGF